MKKLPNVRRRALGAEPEALVSIAPLREDTSIPVIVRPREPGLELAAWGAANRSWIEARLLEHRALLFRGFAQPAGSAVEAFEAFVDATSDGERLAYKDRSTPRGSHGDRIYDATVYPAEQTIQLHNEGTYWQAWAQKIYFACAVRATTGGETPIADVHRVYERIDPAVRAPFAERGVCYVRNYNDGFGLRWQEVFQTESPQEVEAYCAANGIELEWKSNGRLRTRQVRPAIRLHPRSGEPLWFNHAAFFHVSALEAVLRETFLAELGEAELPYNTYYGDGDPIATEVIAHVLAAYAAEKVVFPWEVGDVALYDNSRIAHAREPYTGERLTLVAMTEPTDGTPLA